MATTSLNLGIFGCGTVGSGLVALIEQKQTALKALYNISVSISKVLVRESSLSSYQAKYPSLTFTSSHDDILSDPEINVVVELIGGVTDAKDIVFKAIDAKKHVITANKALIATQLSTLEEKLRASRTFFGYEASVAGGIPIIHTLTDTYGCNENITSIMGILNGTTNYMLSKMENDKSLSYNAVLKEAQDAGFAEANPSADVDGYDVQAKIAILAKLGFGINISPHTIPTVGISQISSADFEYAALMNSTIKLLGVAQKISDNNDITIYVSPVIIPKDNVLASISGATNIVTVSSENLQSSSYVGQGAGKFPTANSVMSDLTFLGRNFNNLPSNNFPPPLCTATSVVSDFESSFYVRITITDGVGIIKAVGAAAEKVSVSIYSILQLPIVNPQKVDFVVTTDKNTMRSNVEAFVKDVSTLEFVLATPIYFPILL